MPSLAAVLWDMDGTLIDSEGLWSVTMGELAVHHGGELSAQRREELTGSSLPRTVTAIREHVGLDPDDPAGVEADGRWLLDRTLALFARGIPWRPGARDALRAVRASGIPTALVTSTYREVTEVSLDTIGREHFDVVVCGDEVRATKPDPAPYLRAAELLGVDPAACVAVEDSPTGTRSAVAAGATVLVVPADVPVPPGERRVHRGSLEGLRPADLEAALNGAMVRCPTDEDPFVVGGGPDGARPVRE